MNLGCLMQRVAAFMKRPERTASPSSDVVTRAFHGDRYYQQLMLSICSRLPVTSFVETGTYLGDTTEYMANAIALPMYTSEVNDRFFQHAQERLARYGNVRVFSESSNHVLKRVIEEDVLGPMPIFYLDAHWYDYWPLLDEIELITSRIARCIVVIDDFEVPGRPEFVFCRGGGGSPEFSGRTTVDERVCNLDLIQDKLGRPGCYQLLYPRYSREEAFGTSDVGNLIGYVALFKNMSPELVTLTGLPFVKSHFSIGQLG